MFLHIEVFTFKNYTQTLLHTNVSTHRHFYTQTLLHTDDFTSHSSVFLSAFTHTDLFTHTQTSLHTHTHTHTHRDTHTHTHDFTQTFFDHFFTQTLLHHRRFHTPTLLHTDAFTHRRIAILPQFLAIEPHFVRKGSRDKLKSQFNYFTLVFNDRTSFRAKGLRRTT